MRVEFSIKKYLPVCELPSIYQTQLIKDNLIL